jgi:hypothetical protein
VSKGSARLVREGAANTAMIAAACVPIALIAGTVAITGVLAVVTLGALLLSYAPRRSLHSALVSEALRGTSLLFGGVALCALGAQLLCAAARGEGTRNCTRLCSAAYASRPPSCADATSHWVDVSEINDAVIGTVYHPERYRALQHPQGLVYLESLTMDGARYFRDTSALASLVREAAPEQARALARSFFAANAHATPVRQTQRNFAEQVMLDSLQAQQFLTATTLAEVPLAITSTLPKMTPGDPVPGVIALSSAGVDTSSSMAIVLAVMRAPQSLAPDHVEGASLVLAQRNGLAWRVVREWALTHDVARGR